MQKHTKVCLVCSVHIYIYICISVQDSPSATHAECVTPRLTHTEVPSYSLSCCYLLSFC